MKRRKLRQEPAIYYCNFRSPFGFLNAVQKVLNGVRKCDNKKKGKKRPILGPIF
jgi:hypothetical protein